MLHRCTVGWPRIPARTLPNGFLSSNSNMWEHAAYVWSAAFIIHAGSRMAEEEGVILEEDSERLILSRDVFYGSAVFCVLSWPNVASLIRKP